MPDQRAEEVVCEICSENGDGNAPARDETTPTSRTAMCYTKSRRIMNCVSGSRWNPSGAKIALLYSSGQIGGAKNSVPAK